MTLDPTKLDRAIRIADSMGARLDALQRNRRRIRHDVEWDRVSRADDAGWDESKHPRAENGQFGKGGAPGPAAQAAKEGKGAFGGSTQHNPTGHLKLGHLPSSSQVDTGFKTFRKADGSTDNDKSWAYVEKKGIEGKRQFETVLDGIAKRLDLKTLEGGPDALTEEHVSNGHSYVFMGPLKKRAKSEAKVTHDYGGDWSKLKDMVRATISVEHPAQLKEAIDQLLSSGIEFAAQPKDNVAKPMSTGYRDVNTLVRLPNGIVAELQFSVKSINVAKQVAHHYYDETIKLAHKMKSEGHEDRPPDSWPKSAIDQYEKLEEAQRAIYNPAWEKASSLAPRHLR